MQQSDKLPRTRTTHLTWIILVVVSLSVGGVISLCGIVWNNVPELKGDWLFFWIYARKPVSDLYQNFSDLPFPYPPTMLLLLKPFGLLAEMPAFAAWTAIGFTLFTFALKQLGLHFRFVVLAALLPCLCGCIFAGQTSLFVGAALIGGVAARNSSVSALLFGIAIVLKPQSAIAVPFALVAIGDWRRLVLVGVVAALLVLASAYLFGYLNWAIWFEDLPRFRALLVERKLDVLDVGVNGIRLILGLPASTHIFGILLGIASVSVTWRVSQDPIERYTALACGAALISPYTLFYDLAGLSVIAVYFLMDDRNSKFAWLASAPIVIGLWLNPGVIGLAFLLLFRHAPALQLRRLATPTL